MSDLIVKGSIRDIARKEGKSTAKAGMDVEHVYIVDTSGSMEAVIRDNRVTAYEVACEELEKLQARHPGRSLIIAFSSTVVASFGGKPKYIGSGTMVSTALEYARKLDGTVKSFTLISDGYPNDPDQALEVAQSFITKINTVYIGQDDPSAIYFMQQVSALSGGVFAKSNVSDLDKTIKLLTAG